MSDIENKDKDFIASSEYARVKAENDRLNRIVASVSSDYEKLKSRVDAFGEVSPEEVAKLKEEVNAAKQEKAKSNPEELSKIIEEEKSKVRKELSTKLTETEQELVKLRQEAKQLKLSEVVLSKRLSEVKPDMVGIVKEKALSALDVDSNGYVVVKDASGNVRYSAANPQLPMSADEYFAELSSSHPSMFLPKGNHKGATRGEPVFSNNTTAPSQGDIDLARFKADSAYRDSLPVTKRAEIYRKLGL